MVPKTRLVVADDHPIVRAGLRKLLETQDDMEIVGEAVDGAAVLECALELRPDIVIIDITMGETNGLIATRRIRSQLPETKVLVLTMHDDEEYLRQALEAGATGYVLKAAVDIELVAAIRAVQRGEVFLYPSFTRVLLGDLGRETDAKSPEDSYALLSDREKQVLHLVALGNTNRQIAEELFLSVKTIETYRARVMQKLGLRSRSALVRYALQRGLLTE